MNKCVLFVCLLIAGCSPENTPTTIERSGAEFTPFKSEDKMHQWYGSVIIVTNEYHRFAVAYYDDHISMCEVTDASLIKSNAEKP